MMCNSFGNAMRIRQVYNIAIAAPERVQPLSVYLYYGPSGIVSSELNAL